VPPSFRLELDRIGDGPRKWCEWWMEKGNAAFEWLRRAGWAILTGDVSVTLVDASLSWVIHRCSWNSWKTTAGSDRFHDGINDDRKRKRGNKTYQKRAWFYDGRSPQKEAIGRKVNGRFVKGTLGRLESARLLSLEVTQSNTRAWLLKIKDGELSRIRLCDGRLLSGLKTIVDDEIARQWDPGRLRGNKRLVLPTDEAGLRELA
jgi:hypothetical protein